LITPLLSIFAPTQIGRIQKMFMQCLGYEPARAAEAGAKIASAAEKN
jgi:hypothetical protein